MIIYNNLCDGILENLSGVCENNCLTALMGPSGCGKTTFLNAICNPDNDVYLDNAKISKKNISFVHQTELFFEKLTVKECFEFHCRLRNKTKDVYTYILEI